MNRVKTAGDGSGTFWLLLLVLCVASVLTFLVCKIAANKTLVEQKSIRWERSLLAEAKAKRKIFVFGSDHLQLIDKPSLMSSLLPDELITNAPNHVKEDIINVIILTVNQIHRVQDVSGVL